MGEAAGSHSEVQYDPGEQSQAQVLARLLTGQPEVVPMDPVTRAAAGEGAGLAVVIP